MLPPAEKRSTPGRNLIFSAIKISRQLGVFLSHEAIANGKIAFYSLKNQKTMKKLCILFLLSVALLTGCKKDELAPVFITLTFEEVPAEYLAGPTAYGENLYSTYTEGTPYTGYSDTRTGLGWEINEAFGSRDFWNGGVAVSRWNDRSTTGTGNQCSVYAAGGAGGSLTFAVATGMLNDYGGDYARIAFGGQTEELIESFWVSNATYPALSMIEGDAFAKQFTYEDADWLKLVITGYNAAGTATGTVDYYLADFRSATAPGVVEGWKEVNLSSLGKVNRLEFSFESSDTGLYGINTPTYFCFDDVVIKK
jgi:hypothetical protein